MTSLTLSQTIEKVESMIDTGNGDSGRLYHILESLKNNKALYRSDRTYLESKLDAEFSLKDEPSHTPTDLLQKITLMIDSGLGDAGRLQHIYDMISNNKILYHSDQKYLEQKLDSLAHPNSAQILPGTDSVQLPKHKQEPAKIPTQKVDTLPPKPTPEKPVQLSDKLRGTMPKGWTPPTDSTDLTGIYEKIKTEEQKLEDQKRMHDEINLQRSKLSQLILNRQEYEKQVKLEQSNLALQIKREQERIANQAHFSEEITSQKKELEKIKSERDDILKKISEEKAQIIREIEQQKKQLAQAQLEQEEIEMQINKEQSLLAQMTAEQRNRLLKQAQIAHDIKQKQVDLEQAKSEYEEIVSQVSQEKEKLVEAEKLKKSIHLQEQDLIHAKEERLKLVTLISKEKEAITKKAAEEKEKLASQKLLSRQLKKEEKLYEKLRRQREKLDEQIKKKNEKIKQKQQLVKKQISEKDKKLKSLGKKAAKKPSAKKTNPS